VARVKHRQRGLIAQALVAEHRVLRRAVEHGGVELTGQ
jgi:hypothetical protein